MQSKAEKLTQDVTEYVATLDLKDVANEDLNDTITFAVIKKFGLSISRGYSEACAARKALDINARGTGFKALLEAYILEGIEEQGSIPSEALERFVGANRSKGEAGSEERKKDIAAYTAYAKGIYKFALEAYALGKAAE